MLRIRNSECSKVGWVRPFLAVTQQNGGAWKIVGLRDKAAKPTYELRPDVQAGFRSSPAPLGFTLLELLLVLLIISIILTFITLRLPNREDSGKSEATRLTGLLSLALDEAVMTGRDYAVALNTGGYEFLLRRDNDSLWIPVSEDEILRSRELPDELDLNLTMEGEQVDLSGFSGDTAEQSPSRIYLLSTGEVSPFVLKVSDRRADSSYQIEAVLPGRIKMSVNRDTGSVY